MVRHQTIVARKKFEKDFLLIQEYLFVHQVKHKTSGNTKRMLPHLLYLLLGERQEMLCSFIVSVTKQTVRNRIEYKGVLEIG